jgi:hypothetical protein
VADDVPIALFGVEAQRKSTRVALGVGRATLSGDGREARRKASGFLPICDNAGMPVPIVNVGHSARGFSRSLFGYRVP